MTANDNSIRAIALFEASKGGIALLTALVLSLLGAAHLQAWLDWALRFLQIEGQGPRTHLLQRINSDNLHIATLLLCLYGALHLTETWGLWHQRIWASWLGCLSAAVYLPFEITALWHHPHGFTAAVLCINLLVVLVLARDIWRKHKQS